MRSWIIAGLAAWIALAPAAPAVAQEYWEATSNHFLTGLNGLLTAPADPVMSVVTPLEEWEEIPVAPVTSRFLGLFQGILLFTYRVGMGAMDMIVAPLPFRTLSPEPRYQLIPGFEYEGY